MFIPAMLATVGSSLMGGLSAAGSALGIGGATAATTASTGAMSALSTGLKVGGALLSGIAGYGQANYMADVARNNAIIASQAAANERIAGQTNIQIAGMKTRAKIARQEAAQAVSGFSLDSRSNTDVRDATHDLGFFDAENAAYDAAQKAWSYDVQANNFQNQKSAYRSKATGEVIGAGLKVGSSLVGGANSFADKWYKLQRPVSLGKSSTTQTGSSIFNGIY